MITQEQLQDRFVYINGTLIYRYSCGKRKLGSSAGYMKSDGYWRVYIHGKGYYLHRLIWLYHKGTNPTLELDHINRNKSDNRIENLREVTHKENQSWMIGKLLYDHKRRF